jgi:hypothetical protein
MELVRRFGPMKGLVHGVNKFRLKNYDIDGVNVFEREWDLLVVLDACRYDELAQLEQELDIDWQVQPAASIATATYQWLPRTFREMPDHEHVAYITANPYSKHFESRDIPEPDTLDEVWRYAWDEETGTVLPRPVTDRAISTGRNKDHDKVIVHYLQPHAPFLDRSIGVDSTHFDIQDKHDEIGIWAQVQRGDIPREEAIQGYRENLRRVIEDVQILLTNFDAETAVVTSDHGEAFGEKGIYGHPGAVDINCLTSVPWVSTSAKDSGSYTPDTVSDHPEDVNVDDRLAALGYK